MKCIAHMEFDALSADSLATARARLRRHRVDLMLISLPMAGNNGAVLIDEVLKLRPEIDVILISAKADMDATLEWMRKGVTSYITRPYTPPALIRLLERARHQKVLQARATRHSLLRNRIKRIDPILGVSPKMKAIRQQVAKAARSHSPVLLAGESGTGKKLMARNVAYASKTRTKELTILNCKDYPTRLLDDALFGHSVLAGDGQVRDELGLLAMPVTILLDQVEELAIPLQSKLFRALRDDDVLQNGTPERPNRLKGRVLAATTKDLRTLSERGAFHPDLFALLNVSRIDLPPLRDRVEDIPELIEAALQRAYEFRGIRQHFSDEALALLNNNGWPGNVAELQKAIHRACGLSLEPTLGLIQLNSLVRRYEEDRAQEGNGRLEEVVPLAVLEKAAIEHALTLKKGDRASVAKLLGISRSTLWRRIDQLGIDIPDVA